MRKYAKLYAAILRVSVVVNSAFQRWRGRRQNCYPKPKAQGQQFEMSSRY